MCPPAWTVDGLPAAKRYALHVMIDENRKNNFIMRPLWPFKGYSPYSPYWNDNEAASVNGGSEM